MAPVSEDDCPVCQTTLSQMSEGTRESHVQTCIESHLSAPLKYPSSASKLPQNSRAQESEDKGESCPICHTSYLTKDFDGSDSAREAHFSTCFESQSSSSKFAPSPGSPPSYNREGTFDSNSKSSEAAFPSEKGAASKLGPTPSRSATMPIRQPVPTEAPPSGSRRLSIFGFGNGKNKEQKMEEKVTKADGLMRQRWGPPGSPTSEMVRRYWMATRMEQHWEYLRAHHPRQFKKYLGKGYMEPIPVCTLSGRFFPFQYLGLSHETCLTSNKNVLALQSCLITQNPVSQERS